MTAEPPVFVGALQVNTTYVLDVKLSSLTNDVGSSGFVAAKIEKAYDKEL